MGCANMAALDTTFVTGLYSVFTAKPVQVNNGWSYFAFDNTYDWDGFSDIIVEVCFLNSGAGSNAAISYHNTPFNSCVYTTSNSITGVCSSLSGLAAPTRPNIRFLYCTTPVSNLTYNWSPSALVSNPAIKDPYLFTLQDTVFNLLATDTVTGCQFSDTLFVDVLDALAISAGNDTTVCSALGLQLHVNTNAQGLQYNWQPASKLTGANTASPVITSNTSQMYIVQVADTAGCANASDTVNVNVLVINAVAGADTTICTSDTIQLHASGGDTYLWSPGNGLSSVTDSMPLAYPPLTTTYHVVVSAFGCTVDDSVTITVLTPPSVELGNDTSFCAGESVVFYAGGNYDSYLWQDNSITDSYTANAAGLYWVQVGNQCGFARDSVSVLQLYPIPLVNLGNGGQLCDNPLPLLDAGNVGSTYLWSTGETSQTITAAQSGDYFVTVTSSDSCVAYGNVSVQLLSAPTVYLGGDTALCIGEELVLKAVNLQSSFEWQDGSSESYYPVREEGLYWLHAFNNCGSAVDSIKVQFDNCDCRIFMPNAFTPNGDGNNETYKPEANCDLRFIELRIFNRWGEMVFETNSLTNGWDGTYKGKPLPAAVYTYVLSYAGRDGNRVRSDKLKGSLTLIR